MNDRVADKVSYYNRCRAELERFQAALDIANRNLEEAKIQQRWALEDRDKAQRDFDVAERDLSK